MAARFENRESRKMPVIPETVKEMIFWCAVLVAVVSGAVLIGRMDSVWRFPSPATQSAIVAAIPATPTDSQLSAKPSIDTLLLGKPVQ